MAGLEVNTRGYFYYNGKIMNAKMTSLLAGVALLTGIGVANAAEPLRLTESSMDNVTAGSFVPNVLFTKYINTTVISFLDQYKDVDSNVKVYGQLSDAEAAATCNSYNCLTETLTVTNTGYGLPTTAYSQSLSATSYALPTP